MIRLRLPYLVPMAAIALAVGLVTAPASAATSGTFTATGTMNASRVDHTATLLPNGTVLAAGSGFGPPGAASAELYGSTTGTWTLTGSMTTGRGGQTATLLANGKVLIAGGGVAAAELYNPATGTFTGTGTGSSTIAVSSQSATLLPNGDVLVAGGMNAAGSFISSAELFNPATDAFTSTGSMTTVRADQSATLLNNGRVLVAGGFNNHGTDLASAELYNPATGKWTATGSMSTPRDSHNATELTNGEVLVTAGVETSGLFSELYNPATGQWSAATGGLAACGTVSECRFGSRAALLGTGDVLVAGGLVGLNSNPRTTATAMLYDPATNAWTTTGSMTAARGNQTMTPLPNGQVLVAGGSSFISHRPTPLSSSELYTP